MIMHGLANIKFHKLSKLLQYSTSLPAEGLPDVLSFQTFPSAIRCPRAGLDRLGNLCTVVCVCVVCVSVCVMCVSVVCVSVRVGVCGVCVWCVCVVCVCVCMTGKIGYQSVHTPSKPSKLSQR
jgi:hypothetical protein